MMKILKTIILMVLFVGIVQAKTGVVTGGATYTMLPWFKSSFLELEDDVDEAKQNNKHVLLFFHLAQCPYCEQMVKDFDQQPLKAFIQKHFSVIAINIRGDKEVAINAEYTLSEKELADEIKVGYTPTMVFLNQKNETVMRTNGYRSPAKIRQILGYISSKAYEKLTLQQYIEKTKKVGNYQLQDHAMLQKITDFSAIKTPLAVIFEDKNCDACAYFYSTTLKNKSVKNEFNAFKVVRFDADSTHAIIDNKGNRTTPKEWVQQLKLAYRPGIILFNEGGEIIRIDGFLYPFHFKEALRFVGGDFYKRFATYGAYLAYRQAQLLEQGIDINIK
ncbi:thioredoxin family protein [Bathymodiolus thermophilus thioautotrophic gill symbiont]|nr:thioredoxin fold domain-containing protein [Bathymodiolus thermophilus thioautotrophic gill symbiont]